MEQGWRDTGARYPDALPDAELSKQFALALGLEKYRAIVRRADVGAGVTALVLFWVPALTRKGGRLHRRAGRIYLWAMGIVVATAMPLSIAFFRRGDWLAGTFLGYLGVITFTAL